MGMDLYQTIKVITSDEYEQLKEGRKLINTYTLDLIDIIEIDNLYKQLAFDIIQGMTTEEEGRLSLTIVKETSKQSLLQYFKENWQDLMSQLKLYDSIFVPEELEDGKYITFQAWKNYKDVGDYVSTRTIKSIEINDTTAYILAEAVYS